MTTLVRVAFILKMPINEVVARVPQWELDLWRAVFQVYGALDWTRDDLRAASIVRTQIAERVDIEDLTVYPDPARILEKARARENMSKADVLAMFGVAENEDGEFV